MGWLWPGVDNEGQQDRPRREGGGAIPRLHGHHSRICGATGKIYLRKGKNGREKEK